MCSRYNLTAPHEAVRRLFGYRNEEPFPPRYNIAPTQPTAIVRIGLKGERELALVRWALLPGWVKDPRTFSTLINARAETVLEKASFRAAMRHRRCLVPATGFYEWTGKPGAKVPHLIRPGDHGIMAFAGIWESWLGADGSEVDTMAVITVAANRTVAPIHDRMPAILGPDLFEPWLDCRATKAEVAAALLSPAPDGLLEVSQVSRELNNPRAEGEKLIVSQKQTFL